MKTIIFPPDSNNSVQRPFVAMAIQTFHTAATGIVEVVLGNSTLQYLTKQASDAVAENIVRQIQSALASNRDTGFLLVDVLDAPTGLTTSNTRYKSIDLTWDAMDGGAEFVLKKSSVSGSGYVEIFRGSGNSFSDIVGIGNTFYYVVSATNKAGDSDLSSEASATSLFSGVSLLSASPSSVASIGGDQVVATGTNLMAVMDDGALVQVDDGGGSNYKDVAIVNSYNDTEIVFVTPPFNNGNWPCNIRLYLNGVQLALAEDVLDII